LLDPVRPLLRATGVPGAPVETPTGETVPGMRRRQAWWYVAAASAALALASAVGTGVYFVNRELTTTPQIGGFQWSERYATLVDCGTNGPIMVTGMRTLGAGKYLPTTRSMGAPAATILEDLADIGFNIGAYCWNNHTMLIGSANTEFHVSSSPPPGVIKIHDLTTGVTSVPSIPMKTCIDAYFSPHCALDGKFSVAQHIDGQLHAYIRSNPLSTGGGRWVQRMVSGDGGGSWGAFESIVVDGVSIGSDTNLYYFDVAPFNATHMAARFPAVMPAGSGIWQAFSVDGLRWQQPRLVRRGQAIGPRVTLQPVGLSHAMRINLHVEQDVVRLYYLAQDGNLAPDVSYYTDRMHWK